MTQRFELLEKLGSGGMGAVWKARDAETDELVALKLVHPHLAEDPDYIARFEREVEVARRIDSPYVVKVLGYGTREGVPYMAMEYVDGQSLRDLLRTDGPMTWEQAKPIVRQVAEALGAAHEVGVIHRDVKPSNILIAADGTAKLADFGIARALDLTRLTGSSTMLGTPHYMAPEGAASPQSDLYALGCVLFEMLTGHPPFEGESQQAVLFKHLRDAPPTSTLPVEARPIAEWLLAKSPDRRPRSAEELATQLALERTRGVGAGPGTRLHPNRRRLAAFAASSLVVIVVGMIVLTPRLSGRFSDPVGGEAIPTASVIPTGTPSTRAPDGDSDGVVDVGDWCPTQAGIWASGCPEPTQPRLSYEVTSPASFRLLIEDVPYADPAQPVLHIMLDGRKILTSVPHFEADEPGWYTDIYSYYDEESRDTLVAPDTTYCLQVTIEYTEDIALDTQTECLTTLPLPVSHTPSDTTEISPPTPKEDSSEVERIARLISCFAEETTSAQLRYICEYHYQGYNLDGYIVGSVIDLRWSLGVVSQGWAGNTIRPPVLTLGVSTYSDTITVSCPSDNIVTTTNIRVQLYTDQRVFPGPLDEMVVPLAKEWRC